MFQSKDFYKWVKLFKESWNSIQDEVRPVKPTMVSPPEMLDSVNALILADRRIRIEDISEQLEISASTAHKIVHDDFSKVSCHWVSQCKTSYCSKNSGNHQLFWLRKECHILLTVQYCPHPPPSKNLYEKQNFQTIIKWRVLLWND